MKKLLLVTISIFFALITTAADLNPFAYGLSSSYDPSTYTLTVNYSLNAPATRVDLVILDGATAVKTISFTNSGDISAGAHTVTPSMLGLAPKAGYTWKLNVYGAAKNAMTYCKTFGNYQQFAIDIDNNTNSPHFGRILTTQPVGYDSSDGKQNAGIYEWDPSTHTGQDIQVESDITPRKIGITRITLLHTVCVSHKTAQVESMSLLATYRWGSIYGQ